MKGGMWGAGLRQILYIKTPNEPITLLSRPSCSLENHHGCLPAVFEIEVSTKFSLGELFFPLLEERSRDLSLNHSLPTSFPSTPSLTIWSFFPLPCSNIWGHLCSTGSSPEVGQFWTCDASPRGSRQQATWRVTVYLSNHFKRSDNLFQDKAKKRGRIQVLSRPENK